MNTGHLNTRFICLPYSMGVRYSNGRHVTWPKIQILDILDHKQACFVQFLDHHLNTRPFDNQTRLVFRWLVYLDVSGYLGIRFCGHCLVCEKLLCELPFNVWLFH